MAATALTTATASPLGSLSAIGTATKAFVVAHPTGVPLTAGIILGLALYHTARKVFKKKEPEVIVTT